MTLNKLLKGVQVAAVICNQWGDSGKGKIVDFLASQWAEVTARGTGGNNAGHTVVVNGTKRIFHLLPSGITHDSSGQVSILGNGMVIDLEVLAKELDELDEQRLPYNNLMVSCDAHVIMPYHIARDKAKNQSQSNGGIGSTGRGVGPCYADKIARRGVMVKDVFDRDVLARKVSRAIEFYPENESTLEEIVYGTKKRAARIKPFVRDTVSEMHRFVREGKKILLEGAQGLLLSIEHGTYPYVTSSDCSLNGVASGVGLSAKVVDLPLGVVKFPFMTRVGAGPFPTELGGRDSEVYCGDEEHRLLYELCTYSIEHTEKDGEIYYNKKDELIMRMINSDDAFLNSVGIRLAAGEYGATTGRPRRVGWVDAVAARYAVNINGQKMVLTKADCLAGAEAFNVCFGYKHRGSSKEFRKDCDFLRSVKPEYAMYRGYGEVSAEIYEKLPASLREAIGDFEKFTGGRVVAVSFGAEREDILIR